MSHRRSNSKFSWATDIGCRCENIQDILGTGFRLIMMIIVTPIGGFDEQWILETMEGKW